MTIEWHEQDEIRDIDDYVEREFSSDFWKHWCSTAYKGCECNDDFKKSVAAFVDDYIDILNRLKEMAEALPEGRDRTIAVDDEEEDEVVEG